MLNNKSFENYNAFSFLGELFKQKSKGRWITRIRNMSERETVKKTEKREQSRSAPNIIQTKTEIDTGTFFSVFLFAITGDDRESRFAESRQTAAFFSCTVGADLTRASLVTRYGLSLCFTSPQRPH